MHIMQCRRDFLATLSAVGAVSALGAQRSLADEGPPETTTIRIRVEDAPPVVVGGVAENPLCTQPLLITEGLLRAEGFTDIRYVLVKNGPPYAQAFERGEIDFGPRFARGRFVTSMPACRSRCWRVCIPAVSSCSRMSKSEPSAI